MKKRYEHIIQKVEAGSIAEQLDIKPGDILLSINGEKIKDVFDYRFLIHDEYICMLVRKPDGEEWELEIEKDYDDDLGIDFENALMSSYKSCRNKCIFCFIDQMPPGMREELYFKDDDSRLSFLQGNYITLTNMTEEDVSRIIKMQLAPINISVQTTSPELRCKMLNNRFAGEKLRYLDLLYEGHVEMNGQIVCCKGVNDGDELKRSIEDLAKYLPYMKSVSVVPAGITRYREGLFPIALFSAKEAGEIIDLIESYQQRFFEEYGLHFIHASDEWYALANRPVPPAERYDGYLQLENGVGMQRLLSDEFDHALMKLVHTENFAVQKMKYKRTVSIATGKLTFALIEEMSQRMMQHFPRLCIKVFAIRNDFFGETITVSGLVTGTDLISQLCEQKDSGTELGDTLLIPANMVRISQGLFLDDVSIKEVSQRLNMHVTVVETQGKDFIAAILNPQYHTERENENFVYLKAFGESTEESDEKVEDSANDKEGREVYDKCGV